MNRPQERSAYRQGYIEGKLGERERLYTTIDNLLFSAAYEGMPQEEYRIVERTLLKVKEYLPKEVKL